MDDDDDDDDDHNYNDNNLLQYANANADADADADADASLLMIMIMIMIMVLQSHTLCAFLTASLVRVCSKSKSIFSSSNSRSSNDACCLNFSIVSWYLLYI